MKWYNKVDPGTFSAKLSLVLAILTFVCILEYTMPEKLSESKIQNYISISKQIFEKGLLHVNTNALNEGDPSCTEITIKNSNSNRYIITFFTINGNISSEFENNEFSNYKYSIWPAYLLPVVISFCFSFISFFIYLFINIVIICKLRKKQN